MRYHADRKFKCLLKIKHRLTYAGGNSMEMQEACMKKLLAVLGALLAIAAASFADTRTDFKPIVITDQESALFNKIGEGILVTHSQGGTVGWRTAIRNGNVKAIVAYEPGGSPFLFPEGETPAPVPTSYGTIAAKSIPLDDFKKLTKIPIVIYYGDNIASKPTPNFGQDQWRAELAMARSFAATINKYGGNATVVHLPEIGITGNTHFIFSDLNNIKVADLLSDWLKKK